MDNWKDRIRELRKKLGLSQQAFAERVKASIDTVRAWERGWWNPSEEFQRRIARLEKAAR